MFVRSSLVSDSGWVVRSEVVVGGVCGALKVAGTYLYTLTMSLMAANYSSLLSGRPPSTVSSNDF